MAKDRQVLTEAVGGRLLGAEGGLPRLRSDGQGGLVSEARHPAAFHQAPFDNGAREEARCEEGLEATLEVGASWRRRGILLRLSTSARPRREWKLLPSIIGCYAHLLVCRLGSEQGVRAVSGLLSSTRRFLRASVVLAIIFLPRPGTAWAGPSSPLASCGGSWQVQRPANIGTDTAYLSSVSGTSARDVWAVGADLTLSRALIEHWNGRRWRLVPVPTVGDFSSLIGVSALTASDAWAVGYKEKGTINRGLAEHWDGTRWRIVPTPSIGTGSFLWAVVAISSNDVWAVGRYEDTSGTDHTLAEHWNGSAWSVVPSQDPGAVGNSFFGVSATSAADVWAVGNTITGLTASDTLVEHWDGAAWTVVPAPSPGGINAFLYATSAVSPTDAWAGSYFTGTTNLGLIEQWDGTGWTVASDPNPGPADNLLGISAASSASAWAVGDYFPAATSNTLTEHWDGLTWTFVSSPNIGTGANELNEVWTAETGEAFAVGTVLAPDRDPHPLIERFC